MPYRGKGISVEVNVDDVLVFLRRVFGKLDGAIRPPVEPLGMLFHPWVVGCALNREVERDVDALAGGGVDEAAKIVERTELGMDGVMPALLRADCVGTAGISRGGREAVVASLP